MGLFSHLRESVLLGGTKLKAEQHLRDNFVEYGMPFPFDMGECAALCTELGFSTFQKIQNHFPKQWPSEKALVALGFAGLSNYPQYDERTQNGLELASRRVEQEIQNQGECSPLDLHILGVANTMRERGKMQRMDELRRNVDEWMK